MIRSEKKISGLDAAQTRTALDVVSILSVCNVKVVDDGNNITHVGYALPGYGTDEAKWLIFKLTYNGSIIATKYAADGELSFNKIFDDYATYTYTAAGS